MLNLNMENINEIIRYTGDNKQISFKVYLKKIIAIKTFSFIIYFAEKTSFRWQARYFSRGTFWRVMHFSIFIHHFHKLHNYIFNCQVMTVVKIFFRN